MDWFSAQLHPLRLKAVNVERERAVSSQNGGRAEEEEDDEEEDSDREETEAQTKKKKQESSYEAAGDSDQEAVGLPSEGEEGDEGEGEDDQKEEEEPVEQMALDKDRVNVRITALEVCWSARALTVCRKLLVAVRQLWTIAMMQRMDSTACLL